MAKMIKEGPGWRWGFDPDGVTFPFLLGADHWAVELTQAEFADFQRLGRELQETILAIAPELMAEERVCCELSSELIWLEVEGFVHSYELRFILQTGRRAEGMWPPGVVPQLLQSLDHC